jgi:GT2 family glycosyltransferase
MSTPMTAVVVSHNTEHDLRACLSALRAAGCEEVVVVDNASSDGSARAVHEELATARLIANDENVGYGVAANQGVAACSTEYVLLLNADAIPRPGALAALARDLDAHPAAALVGPRLDYADGSRQPSCYPFLTPANVLLVMTGLNDALAPVRVLRRLRFETAPDEERSVPWVKGAALALRRRAFEQVGGFDPSFFLYGEELDLCYRLRRAGWDIRFTPAAAIVHHEGTSSERRRAAIERRVYSSLVHFYRRHYSPLRLVALRAALVIIMAARIVRDDRRLRGVDDVAERRELREQIDTWWAVLGRFDGREVADGRGGQQS